MAVSYKTLKKEKKKNKVLGGLLALLLVAGIGVGVYAVTNYDSLDDKDKTQQTTPGTEDSKEDEKENVENTPSGDVTENEENKTPSGEETPSEDNESTDDSGSGSICDTNPDACMEL